MRKFSVATIAALLFSFSVNAQHISDENFQAYLRVHYPKAINKKGDLTKKAEEITSLDISNDYDIKDLSGIEGFSKLEKLDITYFFNGIKLYSCDLPNSLKELNCYFCDLHHLPKLPPNLIALDCNNNKLEEFPVLPASLKTLNCRHDELKELPALPAGLQTLYCLFNEITFLPELPASLSDLDARANNLKSLPSLPQSLTRLDCSYNPDLKKLPDLPAHLAILNFEVDEIRELPVLPASLKEMRISSWIKCLPNKVDGLTIYNHEGDKDYETRLSLCESSLAKQEQKTNTSLPNNYPDPAKLKLVTSEFLLKTSYLGRSGKGYKDSIPVNLPPNSFIWAKVMSSDKKGDEWSLYLSYPPLYDQVPARKHGWTGDNNWEGHAFYWNKSASSKIVFINIMAKDYETTGFYQYYVYPKLYDSLPGGADFKATFLFMYSQSLSCFNLISALDSSNAFNTKEKSFKSGNKYNAVLKSGLNLKDARNLYNEYQKIMEGSCTDARYKISKSEGHIENHPEMKALTSISGLKEMGGFILDQCYLRLETDGADTYKIVLEFETSL